MTIRVPSSQNADWGFFGTVGRFETDPATDAAMCWKIASRAIAEATQALPEGVRGFLDSRYGRHFADDVANGLSRGETPQHAIEAAIGRWMGWRIGRATSHETGIPRGLPYLAGLVAHFEIMAD